MNVNKVHTTLTSFLYAMQIVFLVGLTVSLFNMGLPLFGALVGFATICLLLTSGILFLKYNNHFISESSSLGLIIERLLGSSTYPISVFRKDQLGCRLVYSNNAGSEYPTMDEFLNEIDPLERVIVRDTINAGNPATSRIVTKDESGSFTESEISFLPIQLNPGACYWISHKIKIKEIGANVIPLAALRAAHHLGTE